MRSYELTTLRGSAADFHARPVPLPARPAVWVFDVGAPALVLGSSQATALADAAACDAAGVEVVRRRSGGGAVLLEPGAVVWFDVVVPADVLRDIGLGDDVGRSMVWLGEHVAVALGALDVEAIAVHRRAMVATAWSRLVCFDGLGPGEITTAGGKLVGISARRTRNASRFQCVVHVRWSPAALVELLAPPRPTPAELGPVATLPADVARVLPGAVAAALGT